MTTEALTVHEALAKIQKEIKVPKNRDNKFGGYKYRNAEDIIDAAKLLAAPLGFCVTCDDELVMIGARYYVKSTATLGNQHGHISKCGYAREEETKKGMDGSQITGAASSYARKYALNGLFAIDDGIDSDSTNDGSGADAAPKGRSNPPASKPKPEKPKQSDEVVAAGKKLKELADKYAATEAAKTAPVKALLFDTLKRNGMSGLGDLGKCTNVLVFNELIDVLELALNPAGVSA